MSANPQDKDTMATLAMVLGALVLLAAVIFLVSRLFVVAEKNATKGELDTTARVEENLKPVAEVNAGKVAAGPVVRSGKEIFDGLCVNCHGSGVLGAPKAGNKADWAPRLAKGFDTLLNHATNGFNAMPAKGGDPTLTKADLEKAITYMLEKSGLKKK